MEGETSASIAHQLSFFNERILPTLENNIKSGNSIVDTDFYGGVLDFGEEKKVKPFSWQNGFSEVFKQGGFDVVIGNPPYGALFNASELNYFKSTFKTTLYRGESYLLFIEKALNLLINKGFLGFIIPDTILNLGFTQTIRDYLLRNSLLKEIVSLPSNVFSGATVDTILLFVNKKENTAKYHSTSVSIKYFNKKSPVNSIESPQRIFKAETKDWFNLKSFNLQTDSTEKNLITKIESTQRAVTDIAEMYSGIKVYEVGKGKPAQTEKVRNEKPFTSEKKTDKNWQPFFDGKHIGRYQRYWKNNNWINYGEWLAAPRNYENFQDEKILIRKITGKTLIATYIPETSYCNTLLFVLKLKDESHSYKSILSILNSNLIGWYFRKKFQISDDDTFPQIMIRDILQFPIPNIEKGKESDLNKLTDQLLQLNSEVAETKLESKLNRLKGKIDYCEGRINEIVYRLFELTEDEIKIVEGK